MRFIDGFGNDFNFGNTLTNTRTSATFQHGSISSSSTYTNSTYYYVKYAINGYELGSEPPANGYWLANSGTASLTIDFPNNTKLQGMHLADRVTCNPDCRGTRTTYYVNLFSCENNSLIKTINITTPMSSVTGATGYINFMN